MNQSFNHQFDRHGSWRREIASGLQELAEWLRQHDLFNAAVEQRMRDFRGRQAAE